MAVPEFPNNLQLAVQGNKDVGELDQSIDHRVIQGDDKQVPT